MATVGFLDAEDPRYVECGCGCRESNAGQFVSLGIAGANMPTISRFYGIVVFMNYNDHAPPHFHARYQDQEVSVEIASGMVQGKMSRRALQMLFEWAEQHRDELLRNWERAAARDSLEPIDPLL